MYLHQRYKIIFAAFLLDFIEKQSLAIIGDKFNLECSTSVQQTPLSSALHLSAHSNVRVFQVFLYDYIETRTIEINHLFNWYFVRIQYAQLKNYIIFLNAKNILNIQTTPFYLLISRQIIFVKNIIQLLFTLKFSCLQIHLYQYNLTFCYILIFFHILS